MDKRRFLRYTLQHKHHTFFKAIMRPQELQRIGLSEKEAAVYLALLELGSDTVQNIAKKSSVNRATTYVILDSLRKKGVVSTVDKGKKTYFTAESPEELVRVLHLKEAEIKERERELHTLLPQLKAIYNRAENKPVVRFYEGKEAIKAMHNEFLRSPEEDMDLIYSRDHIEKAFSENERKYFGDQRRESNKKIRTLYTYNRGDLPQVAGALRRKIPTDLFPISCDIAIIGNKVRVVSLGEVPSGIIVEDKETAKTLHSIFNLAWEAAEKYQK